MPLFLLFFGCLEERAFSGAAAERVTGIDAGDLDSDGSADYIIYDYAPIAPAGSGMTVQRQVAVSIQTTASYTDINPELTDIDLLVSDQDLDEFSKSRLQSDTACSTNIGLLNVVCSDVVTCSRLCSSQSLKCKKIAAAHEDVLAGSMISYVQANNEIRSNLLDARRMVLTLRNASAENRVVFLNKLRTVIGEVADINANPLYTQPELKLCDYSDFGVPYIVSATKRIGNYTAQNASYHYRIALLVKPSQQKNESQLGMEVGGVSLTDTLPKSVVPHPDRISSVQSASAVEDAQNTVVRWSSPSPSDAGYLFSYEFSSSLPPESVVGLIKTPDLKVRKLNLIAIAPTNTAYLLLIGVLHNYYLAFGAAVGFTIAALLFLYNIVLLLVTMVREKLTGSGILVAFRRAFGRTDVKWKADSVVAALALVAGYAAATLFAAQPVTAPGFLEVPDLLLKNEAGMVGTGLVIIGMFMLYFVFDNITKITILERAYGMIIRQEKDMFTAKAARLKSLIAELGNLVEEYSKEDFDVSKEYDTFTTLRAESVDSLAKDMTARSKALIEEKLSRAENAVNSLKERKKIADESWPKWKEAIAKMLEEQNEIYLSSLVTVPASLRAWALGRYAHESGAEGIIFERDSLRKRKVSADELVRDMIDRGLLKGALVISQDKVAVSEFAEGGGTVMSALALKLRSYLISLSKNLGQHPPTSCVALGENNVLVIMKGRTMESVLFVNKPKFKEAIEQWKMNMKLIEGL